jgi:hypothetical protein
LETNDWSTAIRAGLVLSFILDWVVMLPQEFRPSLLFLAEVTSKGGPALAKYLNNDKKFNVTHTARFHALEASTGLASPCSFLLITENAKISPEQATDENFISLHGRSGRKRAYLKVRCGQWTIACVHIIANREESWDEIIDSLNDLNASEKPASTDRGICLIGDMNFPLKGVDGRRFLQLEQIGYAVYDPGVSTTFRTKKGKGEVLDYCFSNSAGLMASSLLAKPYTDWETIDHAPIFYRLPALGVEMGT